MALYCDEELVTQTDFYIAVEGGDTDHYVRWFLPMSASTFEQSAAWLGPLRFAFAEDDFGNCFYLDLSQGGVETHPVLFLDHDGGDVSVVAESLTAFRQGTIRRGGNFRNSGRGTEDRSN